MAVSRCEISRCMLISARDGVMLRPLATRPASEPSQLTGAGRAGSHTRSEGRTA